MNQHTFAETEEEKERKELVENAANSLKRENTRSDTTVVDEKSEKKDEKEVKKKLGKLKKFLPTEEDLDKITLRTVWRYVDKQSDKNEEFEIERIQSLIRDIGRVYDPVVNKYKIATIQIEIIKFNDYVKVKNFWMMDKNSDFENLYNNAYLIGTPSNETECMFNYSNVGAMTICKTDEFIIQSIIFDKYQEHYTYSKPQTGIKKLTINQDEMTTQIVENILKKIHKNEKIEFNNELHKILESNIEIKQKQQLDTIKQNQIKNEIDKKDKFLAEKNKNRINFKDIKTYEDYLSVGGGLNWADLIEYCLNNSLYGLENLTHIPGSVGAAPVQNIGAYGVEVSSFIHSVECFNLLSQQQETIERDQCRFEYRNSIFKSKIGELNSIETTTGILTFKILNEHFDLKLNKKKIYKKITS